MVLLIDEKGEKKGATDIHIALKLAKAAGLDLVEVAPQADPPVCKVLDYGKLRFAEQKKKAEARKKQKKADVKEIKLRPNIEDHDYSVKSRSVARFLEDGDKVKITLRFRGREMAYQDRGLHLMERLREDFKDIAKVEYEPKLEGRVIAMILAPR